MDWDGYTGVIPKSAATVAEVLKHYGYNTAAFGKWHNTPATETTAMGPFDRWPNGYGFEHFYGFLAGETSQWEPRLSENYDAVEPPHDDPSYHLTVGHGRQGARTGSTTAGLRPGQAVPDVLGAWRCARAAPHLQGVGRQVHRASSTPAGTPTASASSTPEGDGRIPAGTELTPRDATMAVLGQHPRGRSGRSRSG